MARRYGGLMSQPAFRSNPIDQKVQKLPTWFDPTRGRARRLYTQIRNLLERP